MEIKLQLNGQTTVIFNEANLTFYKSIGWTEVNEEVKPITDTRYKRLTKSQLQELCTEKGIRFEEDEVKRILIDRLLVNADKTEVAVKATNKGFKDSLIKD